MLVNPLRGNIYHPDLRTSPLSAVEIMANWEVVPPRSGRPESRGNLMLTPEEEYTCAHARMHRELFKVNSA